MTDLCCNYWFFQEDKKCKHTISLEAIQICSKNFRQLHEKRENKVPRISTDIVHEESDVKNDFPFPIFDSFYANGGLQTLMEMPNFIFINWTFMALLSYNSHPKVDYWRSYIQRHDKLLFPMYPE